MKTRRHHNTKGIRQVKRGKTHRQVRAMAKRLKREFEKKKEQQDEESK